MPRVNRRQKRRASRYDELDIEFLRGGPHGLPCMMTEANDNGDEETIRAAWESLRSTILPEWIRGRPGTRPYCWWRFDSPGRRETVNGRVHPFDDKQRTLYIAASDTPEIWKRAYSLHRGMPGCHVMPFDEDLARDFMANGLHGRESAIWEPEWSYLQKHSLLLPEDSLY